MSNLVNFTSICSFKMNHVDLLTHFAQFYGYVRDSPHIGRMFVEKEEEGWYGPHCCFECGALLQNQGFGWPLWLSRPGLQDINFCSLPCLIESCYTNPIGEGHDFYTFNPDGSVQAIIRVDWVTSFSTGFYHR